MVVKLPYSKIIKCIVVPSLIEVCQSISNDKLGDYVIFRDKVFDSLIVKRVKLS